MRPDAVGELITAACVRAGLEQAVTRTSSGMRAGHLLDAGGTLDEAQDILGHASASSTQVYLHPDPARLRAAVDAVPSPREHAGVIL